MSTTHLIQQAGAVALLAALVLMLCVTLLRLVALPLAGAALVLDGVAEWAARPLALPAGPTPGGD